MKSFVRRLTNDTDINDAAVNDFVIIRYQQDLQVSAWCYGGIAEVVNYFATFLKTMFFRIRSYTLYYNNQIVSIFSNSI